MAFKLGISQKAYSKIEAGVTKLTVERLVEISLILELNVEDLLSSHKKNNIVVVHRTT